MNKPSQGWIWARCWLLAFASASGIVAAENLPQDIASARQETQISTTYALNPYLRANDLKVSVQEGKATLSGKVEEGVHKDLAAQIAQRVPGIREVENNILVQADDAPAKPSTVRGYGDLIDDATISAAVKSKLVWSRYTHGLSIEVSTERGRVALQGTVDSAASKELAGRLATNTRGVVAVDNRLAVSGGKPTFADKAKVSADRAGRDISDGWITAKVMSTFLYSSNVPSSEILVSTHNRVVTLTGKVNNGAERALAVELARNVRGVASVRSSGLTF